jgi:hypothetical protein
MTELQPTVAEVLNAPRVQWKFNHDTEWQYGRPVAYTDEPSYIIERESDGLRVGVLASFHPYPAPPVETPSGDVPENWQQVKELAKVLTAAAGFGSHVGVTEIAQAEAVLKHLATNGDEQQGDEAVSALDALPRDSVVMVENDDTHRWLAWKASAGDWDVITPRGEATTMTSAEVAALGTWQQLQATAQPGEEVTIDGNVFPVADLPDLLARHMRALDDAHRREKQHLVEQHEQTPTLADDEPPVRYDERGRAWFGCSMSPVVPPPSVPTREQVYLAAQEAAIYPLNHRERTILDDVLALIENGGN